MPHRSSEVAVAIPSGRVTLEGTLSLPRAARAIVLFVHGSGSSRRSPRNRHVAEVLQAAGIGTLLFDLLAPQEDVGIEARFDIRLLTDRLLGATEWVAAQTRASSLPLGYFGASTGAAAALVAAAAPDSPAGAVVSRGGRPDLAGEALPRVRCPTLLIVGSRDTAVLALNQEALAALRCPARLAVVPGATHLFEEPGTLDLAAGLARDWFLERLAEGVS